MQKNTLRYILFSCYFLLFNNVSQAQDDDTQLTYQEFLSNVLAHHPIARQADLNTRLAQAELLAGKGNFDPILTAGWEQKNFDDKLYYRHFESQIRIPTLLGIDVVGGYENTDGDFLNPEERTDRLGLWNVGVEVDLIQGLWINERRTILEQAKIFQNIAENQQQILLNDLLYDASFAYLDWQKYYYFKEVVEENIELANLYYENTTQSYFGGEKTAMDTLEAFILFQDAINLLQNYEGELLKSRQNLENYLWYQEVPVVLKSTVTPESYLSYIFQIDNEFSISNLDTTHPILLEKFNKLSYFEVEQRLKREKLKPKLKAKYNPLLSTSENGISPSFSSSDYKWGFDFSMPLFMRSERADIQFGEIKLQEIALDIQNKRNELINKIEANRQKRSILQQQIVLQEQNVVGYGLLLEGENEKFLFGESSVFLLNKRQEKYLDGRLKLIELNIKLQEERLDYIYLLGQGF